MTSLLAEEGGPFFLWRRGWCRGRRGEKEKGFYSTIPYLPSQSITQPLQQSARIEEEE